MRKLALVAVLVVVAAACDWPQLAYGPAHTGSSPDTSISASAVSSGALAPQWHTDTSTASYGPAAAVAGGIVFAPGMPTGMAAFDADGVAGCSGAAVVCSPLWTATTSPAAPLADPTVGSGVMVVQSGSTLVGFDAEGETRCSGAPKTCAPLWSTDPSIPGDSGPTVAGNLVYQGVRGTATEPEATGLAVYDLAGVQGCSGPPAVCEPLWTDLTPTFSTPVGAPSVADGVAYLVSGETLYAFDATGTVGCSGTAKTCEPLWTAAIDGGPGRGAPVVADGKVFVTSEGLARVVGFDAAGNDRCSGTPKVCTRVWTTRSTSGLPSVANDRLFVTHDGRLAAYDATGKDGCTGGALRTCSPLWTYTKHAFQCHLPGPCDSLSSYTIANNVVYQGYSNVAAGDVTAYDATGTIGCSGDPKVCPPLRSWTAGFATAPLVSNGSLFMTWSPGMGFNPSGFQVLGLPDR